MRLTGFMTAAAAAALTAVVLSATPQVPGVVRPPRDQVGQDVDVVFSATGARPSAVGDAAQGLAVRADLPVMERAAQRAARIAVPLPTGDTVVARLSTYDGRANGFFAGGRLVAGAAEPPVDGEATFTVVDGRLLGRIVHQDRLFIVRASDEAGVYAISEVDSSQLPNEQQPVAPRRQLSEFDARIAETAVGGDTNQYVDLLVVYSAAARAAMGSTAAMQLEVVGAVDNANLALANGGATHRLRLVYQTETSYVEAGGADLNSLADPDDGNMDEVHRLRDQYDADVVSFVGTSNACGLGYLMQSSSISVAAFHDAAFNVTHYSCIYANFTMAHEIGHNMGLQHDRGNAGSTPAYPYAYGYRVSGSRTVMAYDCSSNYPGFSCNTRRAIFSAPGANFPGVTPATPAGVSGSEDNALALNNTSSVVANFRDSTCSYSLSTNASSFSTGGGSGTLTVTTGSGCAWTGVSSAPSTLALSSDPSYLGSRTITFTVAANSGASRSATIYAGGQSVVVSQNGTCTPSVTVSSQSFTRTGGTGTGTATFGAGCESTAWTTASDQSHVTITSGASGTGSGTFGFTVAANTADAARTATVTAAGTGFTITQTGTRLVPSPATMAFGATKAGASGDLQSVTDPQTLTLTYDGPASTSWTTAVSATWLQVSAASGTGSSSVVVSIVNPLNVIGGSTSLSGQVTVTATNAGNSPVVIPVTLTIDQTASTTSAPFGALDTPAEGATNISGAIAVTGWALDDVGVDRVEIWRNCIESIDRARGACTAPAPGAAANFVFIGRAAFLSGARPDVEGLQSTTPVSYRAGWGYLLLTNALPHQTTGSPNGGQGAVTLSAYAVDEEGHYTLLGSRGITLNNDGATAPFGAIDTPDQGGTITATLTANFGWAMTRTPKCIERTRYRVFIDGVARTLTPGTNWFPNLSRSDLAAAYPGLCDTANPLAAYYIDTAALGLANGLHTIGWDVYDDNGTTGTQADDNVAGIGSRYFSILIGSADVEADRRALEEGPPEILGDADAMRARWPSATPFTGRVAAGSRVRLDLAGPVDDGWQVVGNTLRALPAGSTLDRASGEFAWEPPVPYFGAFDFVFVRGAGRIDVRLTITDPTATGGTEVTISSPRPGADPNPVLTVAGRAVDTLAASGSGIAAVHVWAYRIDVPDVLPRFLGAASLEADRYSLRTPALDPGSYDIAVFAWNTRLGAWAPAAVVSIAVR